MIKVRFFARLAELAECDSLDLDVDGSSTPRALLEQLEAVTNKALVDALRYDVSMVSINQKMAGWDDSLSAGDELAFLPPFSGG